ncbi:MAG: ATP-dependent sacrificial sulfur transferase LarE [Oligosphaeraceae bacterium]|nr:ATP-dependent sacrificial sulfur transferase LarE [Oligosphaeraceae bacterium]
MSENNLRNKLAALEALLRSYGRVLLAFSGGVDSSLLAYLGQRVLGEDFLAITLQHSCYPRWELRDALQFAQRYDIRHELLPFDQLAVPQLRENSTQRCYYCKKAMFSLLRAKAQQGKFNQLIDGSNADDLDDFRPGLKALTELNVISPLKILGWSKNEVRQASRMLQLPSAELPTCACLATRIPYYSEVNEEKIAQIEAMEELLHMLGFQQCRARHHGDSMRLELAAPDQVRLLQNETMRQKLLEKAQNLGFRWLSLDLSPFRSGNMNSTKPEKTSV